MVTKNLRKYLTLRNALILLLVILIILALLFYEPVYTSWKYNLPFSVSQGYVSAKFSNNCDYCYARLLKCEDSLIDLSYYAIRSGRGAQDGAYLDAVYDSEGAYICTRSCSLGWGSPPPPCKYTPSTQICPYITGCKPIVEWKGEYAITQ